MTTQIGVPHPIKKPLEKQASKKTLQQIVDLHGGSTFSEKKSDGFRVQIHVQGKKVQLYSSGLNLWNPTCFPDLLPSLQRLSTGIYDGELLGRGASSKEEEYTAVQNRPKEKVPRDLDTLVEQYPLKIDIFDVLHLKGDLTQLPLQERRKILERSVKTSEYLAPSLQERVNSGEELQHIFDRMREQHLEGIIVKNPNSIYDIRRNSDWIKLKSFTSWDLVVLGLYETEHSQTTGSPFSALLCGVYNEETKQYETIVKLDVKGEKKVQEIYGFIKDQVQPATREALQQQGVSYNEAMFGIQKKIPAYCIDPAKSIVLEVKSLRVSYAENWHSCGLQNGRAHSLQISTYLGIREDKTAALRAGKLAATTTREIKEYLLHP